MGPPSENQAESINKVGDLVGRVINLPIISLENAKCDLVTSGKKECQGHAVIILNMHSSLFISDEFTVAYSYLRTVGFLRVRPVPSLF